MDRGDAGGRLDRLDRPGPAATHLGCGATGRVRRIGLVVEGAPVPVRGRRDARARYLLRNGLDYLQYQQYERALKFLRDAEAREKELSAPERQELKRGIESAQAGLRAVADASNRYALSERSHRRNGFTPAIPESEAVIAARPGSTGRDGAGAGARSGAVASSTQYRTDRQRGGAGRADPARQRRGGDRRAGRGRRSGARHRLQPGASGEPGAPGSTRSRRRARSPH